MAARIAGTLAVALLLVRWLIPAEGVERGEQLWIPAAWSALAAAWCWVAPSRRAATWLDGSVAALVAGHLLGGVVVFATGGQLRDTVNLMAEWWGLGGAWIVVRDLPLTGWSSQIRRGIIATAATVAMLGIYQHYWGLPQSVREVTPLIDDFRQAQARGESSQAGWKLARLGIPTSEPGLTLYEKRLRDSREPFGFFALANTLGGLLAACLVWAAAASQLSAGQRWRVVPALGVTGWCLALTKSRTAWVGAACGLCLAGAKFANRNREPATISSRRTLLVGAAVTLAMVAVAAAALFYSGAWDRQILQEAPKSLAYRGQYWIGTLQLIRESPLFGRGLGQFRSHYLRVKLPEASEEIADPHNFVLDAWVNGGLLALIGLAGLIGWAVITRERTEPVSNAWAARGVLIGGMAAFGLAFTAGPLLDGAWDDRYFVLVVVWFGMYWLCKPLGDSPPSGAQAALLALGVHLLGAGGMGMPAVVQTAWLWLAAIGPCQSLSSGRLSWRVSSSVVLGVAACVIAGPIWQPVLAAKQQMGFGDAAAERGDLASARNAYAGAATLDPWNPAFPARLAELFLEEWRRLPTSHVEYRSPDAAAFRSALEQLKIAHERDPHSPEMPRRLGQLWAMLFERTRDREHAQRAADHFAAAVAGYPTHATLLAEWSAAARDAGDLATARLAARRALQQDALNRRLGHIERVLPASLRESLEGQLGDELSDGML